MQWAMAGIVMVLATTACSSGDGGSGTSQTSTQTSGSTVDSDPVTVDSDPVMLVISAHDVDQNGVPVDPALEFAADVTQISVIVLVGEVEPDGPLKVAWTWLDGPDGERPLFEHQIDVAIGDIAYSHGTAIGPVAPGRYRTNVTIGTWMTETVFAVRPTPIEFPDVRSGFALPQQSGEPAPPTRGPSGTIPAPSEEAASGVCQPWVQITSLLAMTGANGCGDNEFEVTAAVGGHSPVGYGRWIGDFIKPVRADPCDLGGSDLDIAPVSYAVTTIAGPDAGKLFRKTGPAPESDTSPPLGYLATQPLPGSQVSAGDLIAIEITADDGAPLDSIVTGIASVELATDTGQQIDGWEFEGPVACDKSRLRRVVQLEYQVPENPPELVTLIATIRDYQGQQTTLEVSYPTVGLWTGYMDVTGDNTVDLSPNTFITGVSVSRCAADWEFRIVVFAPTTGAVYGYADGIPQPPECDDLHGYNEPLVTRLGITGTITPDALTIRFEYKDGGWYGISVLYMNPIPDITLTRVANVAYAELDLSASMQFPDYVVIDTLKGRIDLGCDRC